MAATASFDEAGELLELASAMSSLKETWSRRRSSGPTPRAAGDPAGDAVEPRADRVANPDGVALAHEHQERGLHGIIGVMGIRNEAAAEGQHHWPVPLEENAEGLLAGGARIAVEALEKLGVGQCAERAAVEQCVQRLPLTLCELRRHRDHLSRKFRVRFFCCPQ